jgi:hypothetical protein
MAHDDTTSEWHDDRDWWEWQARHGDCEHEHGICNA